MYFTSISAVASNFAYIRFGIRVYTSFHGVQMDRPNENDRPTLNTTIQIMYQRYVSRKNRIKSITYMMASVIGTWFVQSAVPKNRSLQPWTFVRTMTAIGLPKEVVRKKYDSANLQPKMRSHKQTDAMRAWRLRSG